MAFYFFICGKLINIDSESKFVKNIIRRYNDLKKESVVGDSVYSSVNTIITEVDRFLKLSFLQNRVLAFARHGWVRFPHTSAKYKF